MKPSFCKPVALTNSREAVGVDFAIQEHGGFEFALGNDSAIDDEGWGLIAPFGEHPKTRVYRDGDGQIKQQRFIQVLDNEAAEAMIAKENSFFRKLKRAIVGIPVYKGHGDLNDADPQAVSNDTQKIKLGVVDKVRKTARGIEAHFALDNEGAKAVEQEDHKYPSAFWWVLPSGTKDGATLARPFKLISVALTPYPNISGVESLANARQATPAPAREQQNQNTTEPDMKLIAGWLRARGITLANSESPTESQVLDSLDSLFTSKAGEVTALGNEKSNLTGKITTLECEKTTLTTRNTELTTALSNEQTGRKSDRKGAAGVIVDLAIGRGICTVAERDAKIEVLANASDFAKDSTALLAIAPTHTTTTNGRDVSGKQTAALENEEAATLREYQTAFAAELPICNQDAVKAHNAVVKKHPNLIDKLRKRKA